MFKRYKIKSFLIKIMAPWPFIKMGKYPSNHWPKNIGYFPKERMGKQGKYPLKSHHLEKNFLKLNKTNINFNNFYVLNSNKKLMNVIIELKN